MDETLDRGHSSEDALRLSRLRQLLDEAGADYELLSHPESVVSAEEGVRRGIGSLAQMAPTLILNTEKGLLAAILSGGTRLSYKRVKRALGLKNVSLARPEVVLQVTGAEVGTVSLVNEGLPTIVDSRVAGEAMVYGGCGVPRHTLRINPRDLIRVTHAEVFDLARQRDGQG